MIQASSPEEFEKMYSQTPVLPQRGIKKPPSIWGFIFCLAHSIALTTHRGERECNGGGKEKKQDPGTKVRNPSDYKQSAQAPGRTPSLRNSVDTVTRKREKVSMSAGATGPCYGRRIWW